VLIALVGLGAALWYRGGIPGGGDVPEVLEDVAVTGAVEMALRLNRRLRPYPIEVHSDAGLVTLQGEVPGEAERDLAEAVAAAVPRVDRVENGLVIDPRLEPPPRVERSFGEALDDRTLAVRVDLAFALNRRLEGVDIDVSAYRGELSLSGEVAQAEQRDLAVAIARDTPGVTGVTDRLRVAGEIATEGIVEEVIRALRSSPVLGSYGLEAVEREGRLVLRGRVAHAAERELAAALAREAAGSSVDNEIEVRD
jgi:osmotically-inducible protein OsmY